MTLAFSSLPATLAPSPALAAVPLATPNGVLFYCEDCLGTGHFTSIKSYYSSLGASRVDIVTEGTPLPVLSNYRLIFISLLSNLSAAEVSSLNAFVKSGGRLVVVGDNPKAVDPTPGNNLLAQLRVPIRFTSQFTTDNDCPGVKTNNYAPHLLTGDLPTTGVDYTGPVTLDLMRNPNVARLISPPGMSDTTLLAVYPKARNTVTDVTGGDVVVAGDGNFFGEYCRPQNQKLWANLFLNMDDDNDGLLNDWEIKGYDADGDGIVDVNLPLMGAKPKRKNIFIESDWMEGCPGTITSRKPSLSAINAIVNTFATAPVNNPDGTIGIILRVDYGQPGAFGGGGNKITCIPTLNWPANFDTLKRANFSSNRHRIFHYSIWGHQFNGSKPNVTGIAEQPGDDFLVTLTAGTPAKQAGTFMHELGHNLGLSHGGVTDFVNNKPNHLSVMNYSFQQTGLIFDDVPGTFDYSRSSPPALNESNLNENVGINGGSALNDYGTVWYCLDSNNQFQIQQTNIANGAIDWNCQNGPSETGVTAPAINQNTQTEVLRSPGVEWSYLVLASTSRPGIPSGILGGNFVGPQLRNQIAKKTESSTVIEEGPELSPQEVERIERRNREYLQRQQTTKPLGVKAQRVGINSVSITWKPPIATQINGQAIVGYEVKREEQDNLYTRKSLGKTTNLSFLDNTAERGKSYVYLVRAITKNSRGILAPAVPVQIP